MDIREAILKSYPFLGGLSNEDKNDVLSSINVNTFPIGHKLITSLQTCTGFSFILSGKVRVYRIGEDGKEITLYRLKRGDSCFNTILCMLTESENHSFAEVEENATIAILPMDIFKKKILDNKDFLKYLFTNLYGKFEGVVGSIENITFNSIENRLQNFFVEKLSGKNSGIIYTTHEKVAADIGSSREVVSRSLKFMEKEGKVELSRGKIKVVNLR
ncbi:MAG: Crp/Fnr family transcriptional regulator [Clostridium sp.]